MTEIYENTLVTQQPICPNSPPFKPMRLNINISKSQKVWRLPSGEFEYDDLKLIKERSKGNKKISKNKSSIMIFLNKKKKQREQQFQQKDVKIEVIMNAQQSQYRKQ